MADYEFRSLSPHDFEMLSRDLLQKPLGVRLESFTAGRDSGIDFRYRRGDVILIVQCKHYAESGYEALARVLKAKERKKLDALKPTRYILATSVGLTPDRKKEILEILSPYCAETNDILGRDDLNVLERADEIETERAEPEPDDDDEGRWSGDVVVDDVSGMFDGLQSDLKDT